jgi:hypothetical protein
MTFMTRKQSALVIFKKKRSYSAEAGLHQKQIAYSEISSAEKQQEGLSRSLVTDSFRYQRSYAT